jgi:DDE family transposase
MERDECIITVYCLVCEHSRVIKSQYPLRRGGFAPALTDEEVITLEICGEYLKLPTDKDLFAYFRTPYAPFFPGLTDRTLFVRQAANLWRVKAAIPQRLTCGSGQAAEPLPIIDTLLLPVCGYTRSGRDRCFNSLADYGHCAAKKVDYYGFKLGLPITRWGMIPAFPLLPARPHDLRLLDDLGEGVAGLVPADTGVSDAFRLALRAERQGVFVVTPPRQGRTTPHKPALLTFCAWVRKEVETVGAHLTERFALARMRVHDLWHRHPRLIRKVLAHTVGVFLNLQLGRPPLDLDGLVTV